MKFGFRVPSIKKRIAARLSVKRVVRHSLGFKMPRGLGMLTSPKKALYNKVYNKTTFGFDDIVKGSGTSSSAPSRTSTQQSAPIEPAGKIIRSSSKALTVTDENLATLREEIAKMQDQRNTLTKQIESETTKLYFLNAGIALSYIFIIGFFNKKLWELRTPQFAKVQELRAAFKESYVTLTFANNDQLEKSWLDCVDAFNELKRSQKIWDLTLSKDTNKARDRTTAELTIERTPITFGDNSLSFIRCDLPCLYFPNSNGPDIYIYPTFLVLYKDQSQLGIFDLKTKPLVFTNASFHEIETVPSDTEIIEYTWKKTNKDGSMDKRYAGNYQIPVVRYGKLDVHSENGLDESYMFSNHKAFNDFEKAIETHYKKI